MTRRGRQRRVIVRDDEDRQCWVELFQRVALRYGWRRFAWALMSNDFQQNRIRLRRGYET